jgi:mannonate dehydratase
MPVLDWSRTDLEVEFEDGSITTKFEAKVFAAFDIFILKRPHAEDSYGESLLRQAKQYYEGRSEVQKERLIRTVLLGFPGSGQAYSMERLKVAIEEYRDVGDTALRDNLSSFLKAIIPVAEESGVLMAIHPDDPPWSLLGLPRVVSNKRDVEQLLGVLDSPSNGITLCTGSFGAGMKNDLQDLTELFAQRIKFIHLRNVTKGRQGDFVEDNHLEGDVDMYAVIRTLFPEQ